MKYTICKNHTTVHGLLIQTLDREGSSISRWKQFCLNPPGRIFKKQFSSARLKRFPHNTGGRVPWNACARPDTRRGGIHETLPPNIKGNMLCSAGLSTKNWPYKRVVAQYCSCRLGLAKNWPYSRKYLISLDHTSGPLCTNQIYPVDFDSTYVLFFKICPAGQVITSKFHPSPQDYLIKSCPRAGFHRTSLHGPFGPLFHFLCLTFANHSVGPRALHTATVTRHNWHMKRILGPSRRELGLNLF